MPRLLPLLGASLLALSLSGCPRTPDAPEPGMGTPCVELEDCNAGVTCGALRLCVAGFCERDPSLVRPCPGVGAPVVRPDP